MSSGILEFMDTVQAFVQSSKVLRDAARLCDNDPIKQEMIGFIQPRFEAMCAKSEGITVLLNGDYSQNKPFILSEMSKITQQNLEMAQEINDILGHLDTN